MTIKPVLCLDMDGVLADFDAAARRYVSTNGPLPEGVKIDEIHGLFSDLPPVEGALEAFSILKDHYEVHILSTAPWDNPSAWQDKISWVHKHLGEVGFKRLTLTHNKHMFRGDIIVDDRIANGVDRWQGEHVHFATEQFPNWFVTLNYLLAHPLLQK